VASAYGFLARLALYGLVFFVLLLHPTLRPYFEDFSASLAGVSAFTIRLFGGSVLQEGNILWPPGSSFAMKVLDGCNGINVVILLSAAILAYPASWKWRGVGVGAGLLAIQILNLLRLISLFYLGQWSESLFNLAHLYLWETLIILDALFVFGLWSRRAVTA